MPGTVRAPSTGGRVCDPQERTIVRAPLRISFFGGGTDSPEFVKHNGPGLVLGTAINVYVEYRGLRRWILPEEGLGSGLGMSSAMHVVARKARHFDESPHEIAWTAWKNERFLGSSTGWQDAAFAAFGGFNLIRFHADRFEVEPLASTRLDELQDHLLLVYTGSTRTSDVAQATLARVENNSATLRTARAMAEEGHRMLTGTVSMQSFGSLLHSAWQAKKSTCSLISSPNIDEAYERGISGGAWGGKLLGAGGGGYLLFIVTPERRAAVLKALSLTELPIKINARGVHQV